MALEDDDRPALTQKIVELLWDHLKKDPEYKDRRCTGWGTKTKIGLRRSIEATLDENWPPKPSSWAQSCEEEAVPVSCACSLFAHVLNGKVTRMSVSVEELEVEDAIENDTLPNIPKPE